MMSEIIPRWEWRSFGLHFGDAEVRLKTRGTDKLQHSDEIYLLSSISDANVKIREGQMDIKRLEQTDTHGFEQWRPVLKEAFPLPAAAMQSSVRCTWSCCNTRATYRLRLISFLSKWHPIPECVRLRFTKPALVIHLEGCMAELTEVTANGETIRTIAVESEDPACIVAALRALGLEGVKNVSYPCGLKRLVKMTD